MRYYGIVRNLFAMKRILVIVFLISSSFLTQAKDSYEDYFQDEQEEVAKFLKQIAQMQTEHATLLATTPEQIWL